MYKLTRTALTLLLMLAIPLQGFAATAMLFCAPSHHGTAAHAISQSVTVNHHFGLAIKVEHQHGDQVQAISTSPSSDLSVNNFDIKKTAEAGKGKCSACASCCMGSILISTQSFSHVAMTGSETIPFIQKLFVNFTPKGLDPPPKSFLA
jgi:hypothetical protein